MQRLARFRRFRLKSLLSLVLLTAVAAAIVSAPVRSYHRERAAVAALSVEIPDQKTLLALTFS